MALGELRTVFLIAYLLFVIWSLYEWVQSRTFRGDSLRGRIGSIGLIAGSASASLLIFFYVYIWVNRELPAHGSALWSLMVVGEGLALGGLILGLIGTGWIRQSAFLISIVVVFQWAKPSVGRGPIRSVDIAVLAFFVVFGSLFLIYRKSESRPNPF